MTSGNSGENPTQHMLSLMEMHFLVRDIALTWKCIFSYAISRTGTRARYRAHGKRALGGVDMEQIHREEQ